VSAGPDDGEIAATKRRLRSELRTALRALAPTARADGSAACVASGRALVDRLRPAALGSFLALPSEPDLAELHAWWWSRGHALLLPRVVDDHTLAWHTVASLDHVRPGRFGISEPDPEHCPAATLPVGVLLLVPGLGFAADGRRLGRGAGYYDRALRGLIGTAIGIGFAVQRRDDIPMAGHDVRLHGVVLDGLLLQPIRGES